MDLDPLPLPALLLADLHLTANPRDEYRWSIRDWVLSLVSKYGLRTIIILGDLTDAKDNHSAILVNRIVEAISRLSQSASVIILRGNHDYLVYDHPFFGFLSHLPNVRFIKNREERTLPSGEFVLFLPHTKTPNEDWKDISFGSYSLVFMHQTVSGAVASNGMKMEGELAPEIGTRAPKHQGERPGKIYSGDIHVPQVIGNVEYVGSPYHVHFGDRFKARAIIIGADGPDPLDVHMPSIEKFVARITDVSELDKLQLKDGDQLKVSMTIPTSMTSEWANQKKQIADWCAARGVKLNGIELQVATKRRVLIDENTVAIRERTISTGALIRAFADKEKLPADVVSVGLEIANVAQSNQAP